MWTRRKVQPYDFSLYEKRAPTFCVKALLNHNILCFYLFMPSCTATATVTVAPTMELLLNIIQTT